MGSPNALTDDELGLADYFGVLRRRWPWLLLVLVLVLGAVTGLTVTRPRTYVAVAQVAIGTTAAQDAVQPDGSGFRSPSRQLSNEVDLALSDSVKAVVEGRLGVLPTVAVAAAGDADSLSFRATSATAADAATYANTWAQVFVDTKRQQAVDSINGAIEVFEADLAHLRAERETVRAPIDDLEDQLTDNTLTVTRRKVLEAKLARLQGDLDPELKVLDARVQAVADNITNLQLSNRLSSAGTARVVQVAAPPRFPVNAPLSRNLILGGVVGLILGVALALMVDNLDRTIKGVDDLVGTGVPVLGVVPDPGRRISERELPLATMQHAGSPTAEAYQKIRTSVEFALLGRHISSLVVTSPNQSEGKTTLAANLAWAMSAIDHRVALVDVDFRRPRLHQVYGCPSRPGLSDHLRTGIPLTQLALRVGDHGSRNLVVIPTGTLPPNPSEFVASPPFTSLIRDLEEQADLVVLDAPPVRPVADALSISRTVDAVVVVVRAGRTRQDQLSETLDSLHKVGADVLGICLAGGRKDGTAGGYGAYPPVDPDPDPELAGRRWFRGKRAPVGRGTRASDRALT